MKRAAENMCVGKLSGAVGTYADIDPYVEEYVCKKLGLKVESVATQVVQRDHHAEYISTLGVIAGTLSQMALEVRHLQRTEVREGRIFQPETERLLRHAPQTEPGAQRTYLRHGPAGTGLCAAGF